MRRLSWIVLIVIAVGAIGVASWYLASRRAGGEEPVPTQGTPALGSVIASSLPAERTFSQQIPWIGTVESRASVELKALQAGRVESLETGDQTFVQVGTAVSVRLRPILMTAATTIFALIPVAVNPAVGSRIFQPFAMTVIGGLLSTGAATLVLVPVLVPERGKARSSATS